MLPSECPDLTPREVAREAGCERVETSGLLRPNFPCILLLIRIGQFHPEECSGRNENSQSFGGSGCRLCGELDSVFVGSFAPLL